MLFAWACVAGLWIFAWALYVIFSKKTFKETVQRTVTSGLPPQPTTVNVTVRTAKYLATLFVFAGGAALIVLALLNYGLLWTPANELFGRNWSWYVTWIIPGVIMLVILGLSICQPSAQDEESRKNYMEAMKALITAAGLTVGFVAANLKPSGLPQPWIDAIRASIVSLVVCVVCAVTTLFAVSILYDYSRSKQRPVPWALLLCFALPEAYFAVAFFFRGFINLIRISAMPRP